MTTDLWSNIILQSYMAITVHYCMWDKESHLELRARLLAIHQVIGSHSGDNLAETFVEIIQKAGIINQVSFNHNLFLYSYSMLTMTLMKIGCITVDNTSNCDMMMIGFEARLCAQRLSFHHDGNHIRYVWIQIHSSSSNVFGYLSGAFHM